MIDNNIYYSYYHQEFGLESDGIAGESYILPNTIVPYEGDFFTVDHIKDSTWLFQVDNVEKDTLDNGNNVYKVGWHLERTTNEDIILNVVEEYKYVDTVEGTNTKSVVKLERYDVAVKLEGYSDSLVNYFIDLFYDKRVQTFTYKWYFNYDMYDPFSIEFIMRNKILARLGKDYIVIDHALPVPKTFAIEYDKTMYRAFEKQDKNRLAGSIYQSQADYIDHNNLPVSIFSTRYEDFWALNYKIQPGMEENTPQNPKRLIPLLPDNFIDRIVHNVKFDPGDPLQFLNIIIKYFNKEDLLQEDLDCIDNFDIISIPEPYDTQLYYLLIFTIFCIDYYCKMCLR